MPSPLEAKSEVTTGKHGDKGRYVTTDQGSQIFLTQDGKIGQTGKSIGGEMNWKPVGQPKPKQDWIEPGSRSGESTESDLPGESGDAKPQYESPFVQSFAESIIANIRKHEQQKQQPKPPGPNPQDHEHHISKLPIPMRQSILNWSAEAQTLINPVAWASQGSTFGSGDPRAVKKATFDKIDKAELNRVVGSLSKLISVGDQQGVNLRPFIRHNNIIPRELAAKLKPSDLFNPVQDNERYQATQADVVIDRMIAAEMGITVEEYAARRAKNSPGQMSLFGDGLGGDSPLRTASRQQRLDWDESKVKRDTEGKFAEKDTRGEKTGEQFLLGKRAGDAKITAGRLFRKIKEDKYISIVGQKVSSMEELAELAQVYRDPRFETFRAFFVKDGKVIGHNAYTSREPGLVYIPENVANKISSNLQNLDADGFYILHNHPSGNPSPSPEDIALTKQFHKVFGDKLMGHTIINHNKGTTISPSGQVGTYDLKNEDLNSKEKAEVPSDILDETILGVSDLGKLAMKLRPKNDRHVVILASVKGVVQVVFDVSDEAMKQKSHKIAGAIKRASRMTGSTKTFLIVPDKKSAEDYKHHVENGVFVDIATPDGKTIRAESTVFIKDRPVKPRVSETVNESGKYSVSTIDRIADQLIADELGLTVDQYAARKKSQKGQQEFEWITVNADKGKGQPVMIDKKDGTIKAGMGGKFDGQKIGEIGKTSRGKGDQKPSLSFERYNNKTQKIETIQFNKGDFVDTSSGTGGGKSRGKLVGVQDGGKKVIIEHPKHGNWNDTYRTTYSPGEIYPQGTHLPVESPKKKEGVLAKKVIDAVNKKNEPEGGWSDADRVPSGDKYGDRLKAMKERRDPDKISQQPIDRAMRGDSGKIKLPKPESKTESQKPMKKVNLIFRDKRGNTEYHDLPVEKVVDPKMFGHKVEILPGGHVRLTYKGWGIMPSEFGGIIREEVEKHFYGKKADLDKGKYGEGFWRGTNNKNEKDLLETGQMRNSKNFADGTTEKGVSVAEHVGYGATQGYKYMHRIDGEVIGTGSDGEPVLDPKTIKVRKSFSGNSLSKLFKDDHAQLDRVLENEGWDRKLFTSTSSPKLLDASEFQKHVSDNDSDGGGSEVTDSPPNTGPKNAASPSPGSKPTPAPKPAEYEPPTIPGQQTSLFGGDDLNTGQKSLFNMARPSKADQRAAKRDMAPPAASLLEQIDDEEKKRMDSRKSLPGQRDMFMAQFESAMIEQYRVAMDKITVKGNSSKQKPEKPKAVIGNKGDRGRFITTEGGDVVFLEGKMQPDGLIDTSKAVARKKREKAKHTNPDKFVPVTDEEKAIVQAVGDKKKDVAYFKQFVDEAHKEISGRLKSDTDAMRETLAQFGYTGTKASGFLSSLQRRRDTANIPAFDQMLDYVQKHHRQLLTARAGESTGAGDEESMLFNRLKAGFPPSPKKSDPEVIEAAWGMSGIDYSGLPSEWDAQEAEPDPVEELEDAPFAASPLAATERYAAAFARSFVQRYRSLTTRPS